MPCRRQCGAGGSRFDGQLDCLLRAVSDQRVIEPLEGCDSPLPTEVLLRPSTRSLTEGAAVLAVVQEHDDGVDELVVVIGEQEMLTGVCLDAFCCQCARDHCLPRRERLEHLQPHPATHPN